MFHTGRTILTRNIKPLIKKKYHFPIIKKHDDITFQLKKMLYNNNKHIQNLKQKIKNKIN